MDRHPFLTNTGPLLVNTRKDFVTNNSTKRSCPYHINNTDEAKRKCIIVTLHTKGTIFEWFYDTMNQNSMIDCPQ